MVCQTSHASQMTTPGHRRPLPVPVLPMFASGVLYTRSSRAVLLLRVPPERIRPARRDSALSPPRTFLHQAHATGSVLRRPAQCARLSLSCPVAVALPPPLRPWRSRENHVL